MLNVLQDRLVRAAVEPVSEEQGGFTGRSALYATNILRLITEDVLYNGQNLVCFTDLKRALDSLRCKDNI